MLALSQDAELNRPIEAKEHARRFHELFFTLSPQKASIESNMNRAFNLSDHSSFNYYKDLLEKGYYTRIITANIQQNIVVDSVVINMQIYPHKGRLYARQFIIRSSNITQRSLQTSFELINSVRSDVSPQGFMLQNFKVLQNKDIETITR